MEIGGSFVDKVTENFISEFKDQYELDAKDTSTLFEYFSNYCVVCKENGSDDFDIEDLMTGIGTQGIDGIAIIVNGKLVTTVEEIDRLIKSNKTLNVKFVFSQAKTSDDFDNKEIGNFLSFTTVFFTNEENTFMANEMEKFIDLKNHIYASSMHMKNSNPELILYYVTTGNWTDDANINIVVETHKKALNNTNLFSDVRFVPCGASEIQKLYRKTKSDLVSTFKFEKKVTMFTSDDGEVGYYGILPFKEYKKVIIDDEGVLKPVFEDNIRDFLGVNIDVNIAIEQTIKSKNINSFSMLNNGITIVADSANGPGDILTINNYQIVNGCQTSHILYLNKDLENIQDLMIPLRIIVTKDETLKNSITKATNNQTAIKKEQLEALSTFQKNLEEYYKTYTKPIEQLFYERRTGQYRNSEVPKSKIVSIPNQIKTVTAMFLDNPHGVSGQYGTIAKNVGNKIFKSTDRQIIYYTSSLALYRIEALFKNGRIDSKYRKTRYHAIMLLRIIVGGSEKMTFNAKKMETYCQKILDLLNNENRCFDAFNTIVNFIISIDEIDFDDRKSFERKETTDVLLGKIEGLIETFVQNGI